MENATHSSKNKKLIYVILIPLILLIAIYLGVTFYFKNHFYFGSIINGINYSGKTVAQVENSISNNIANYSIELIGRNDLKDIITASEINYTYISDGTVQKLKDAQNPFAWIISLFHKSKESEMSVNISFDEDALRSYLSKTIFFEKHNITNPKNAYVNYDNEKQEYVLVPEEIGSKLLFDKTFDVVKTAVSINKTSLDLDFSGCYKQPVYTTETTELNTFYNKVNNYANAVITYDFSDRQEIVDISLIHSWLKINNKKLTVSIDETAIKEYVDYLGRTYNTFGASRKFKTTMGKTLTVSGGDYGWLINRPAEVKALKKNIKKGETLTKEPIYTQKAVSRSTNDIGNTYVEINLTKQRLWFYKNNKKLVSSDLVSGNISRSWNTPSGIYEVTYKERDAILGVNSGADYRSHVSYWMPFNGNIGMHDATWRSSFGGAIYKTNGSHGCINLPLNKAKIIYENISSGVPVVVYQ